VLLTPPSGRAYWTNAGTEPLDRLGGDAEFADVVDPRSWWAQAGPGIGSDERAAVLIKHPDLSILGQGKRPQTRGLGNLADHRVRGHPRFCGERAGSAAELLPEVAADPVADDLTEDEGKADEDEEREAGRGDRDPPADGDALEERQPSAADPLHPAAFST
jgi:hypothetical protein